MTDTKKEDVVTEEQLVGRGQTETTIQYDGSGWTETDDVEFPKTEEQDIEEVDVDAEAEKLLTKEQLEDLHALFDLPKIEPDTKEYVTVDETVYKFIMNQINEDRQNASAVATILMKAVAGEFARAFGEKDLKADDYTSETRNRLFAAIATDFFNQHGDELKEELEKELNFTDDAFKRAITCISHTVGCQIKAEYVLLDLMTVQILHEMSKNFQKVYLKEMQLDSMEQAEAAAAEDSLVDEIVDEIENGVYDDTPEES